MHIPLPKTINWILSIFAQHDVEVFLVGGCVRDYFLNRPIHDFDMSTKATPKELIAMFEGEPCKVLPLGLQHGTITILKDEEAVEITTYRFDGDYEQHRKPKQVQFTTSILQDLARRDFTINALAWHPDHGLLDPFDGLSDVKQHIIRCVNEPMKRYEEDALRILRALRFSFSLGFEIEENTLKAIQKQAHLLEYISKERIRDEFNKMLESNHPNILTTLKDCDVLLYIIPEMKFIYDTPQESKWHCFDVLKHSDIALNHSMNLSLEEKLALVFHDLGKAETKTFDKQGFAHFKGHAKVSVQHASHALKVLAYSKKTINKVLTLIHYHDYYVLPEKRILRRFLAHIQMDYDMAYAILRVQYCDDLAKNMELAQAKIENLKECVALLKGMEEEADYILPQDLRVNGVDMMELGLKGKEIGFILKQLYRAVLDNPNMNQKDSLLSLANELIQKKEGND